VASRAVKLCGTEQVDPPLRRLTAGRLSADFDNGALRNIRVDGVEVLRGIAFLVRDENWGTFTPRIEGLSVDERADGFTVRYRATCADAQRSLVYDATISGSPDGSLSFEADAEPQTDVLTNRTGFIVLHPIRDLAGQPVKVLREDGTTQTSVFPEMIDPRVPFTKVRALSHEFAPEAWATCSMEGEDAFEMEDQRNWSDASYKTYVRSLKQPWPYTLPKDKRFQQAVRLTVEGGAAKPDGRAGGVPSEAVVRIGQAIGTVPRIGIGVPAEEAQPALDRSKLMQRLSPRWLVCQIDLRLGHGLDDIQRYAALAELTGAGVVLEIISRGTLDPHSELQPIADAVRKSGLSLEAVTVFPAQDMVSVQPDAPWPEMPSFQQTYDAARRAFPGVTLGGGMAAYFTELNRKRPPADAIDYATFTTCPAVHAADDVSVMETLEAIPHQIRSTKAIVGPDKPLRMGPIQLGCRENPYGKATTPNTDNRRACLSCIDPRQRGLYNAAWTLGYLVAVAREGVEALAFGAPTGPFGLASRPADFEQPGFDGVGEALVYPAFHVVAGLTALSGAPLLDAQVTGEGIAAIAVESDGRTVLWIANLGSEAQAVHLSGRPAEVKAAILSADTFDAAVADPDYLKAASRPVDGDRIDLDAYAVARIELG
jgi:hypothetical protein